MQISNSPSRKLPNLSQPSSPPTTNLTCTSASLRSDRSPSNPTQPLHPRPTLDCDFSLNEAMALTSARDRSIYFNTTMLPSPFTLFPPSALSTLNDSFWNYNNSKFSYPELSHRSPHYANVNQLSMDLLADYFKIPKNYQIVYLTAEAGLAAIPHNLTLPTEGRAIYIVDDADSELAFREGVKVNPQAIRVADEAGRLLAAQQFNGNRFYTYYSKVSRESGNEREQLIPLQGEILVCNLTFCAHWAQIDISKHGMVFFDTGKGMGLAGMTVVIVRDDLVKQQLPTCPDLMSFEFSLRTKSIINTPYTLVPLLLTQTLTKLLQQPSPRPNLSPIKQAYLLALQPHTQIAPTTAPGLLRFKLPPTSTPQSLSQLGYPYGQWLTLLLQQCNAGAQQQLCFRLF